MIRTVLFFAAIVAQAQPISYGVKGGVPLDSHDSNPFSQNNESRWNGGPSVELHLPWNLSVEFNGLYRSSHANWVLPIQRFRAPNPYLLQSTEKSRIWDFPLLLKYRFLTDSRIRPFVSAGASWSYRRSEGTAFYSCLGPEGSCSSPGFPEVRAAELKSSQTRSGPAAGVGVDFKMKYFTLSPELRYNQWSGNKRNAFTILLGLSFGR
jgi:hypothetical protein